MKNHKKLVRLVEFFCVGLAMGIVEDLIAIKLATHEPITFKIVLIAAAVALPFAIFSELIVDTPKFWKKILKRKKKN